MKKFVLRLIPGLARDYDQYIYKPLLSPSKLEALNARISANADALIAARCVPEEEPFAPTGGEASKRGRPRTAIHNPLYGFVGARTERGRYVEFAMDAIYGAARLDWYGIRKPSAGKYMPLSTRKLFIMLEQLPVITTEAVCKMFGYEKRHAQRYVSAFKIALPYIMNMLPDGLIFELCGEVKKPAQQVVWEDLDDFRPSPQELERLHWDMRDLGLNDACMNGLSRSLSLSELELVPAMAA